MFLGEIGIMGMHGLGFRDLWFRHARRTAIVPFRV